MCGSVTLGNRVSCRFGQPKVFEKDGEGHAAGTEEHRGPAILGKLRGGQRMETTWYLRRNVNKQSACENL